MQICRRLISSSAVARMPRHPVITRTELSRKSINVLPDGEYAPEFAINKQIAESMEPWVPEQDRKRVSAQRKQTRLEQQRRDELAVLSKQVAQFNLTSQTDSNQPPAVNDTPHPDVMEEYRRQLALTRQRYSQELAEQKEKQQEKLAVSQNDNDAAAAGADATADGAQETLKLQQQAEQDALDLLHRFALKSLRNEEHVGEREKRLAKQKESITRLYHRSQSFITAETLESSIDKCLMEPVEFPSRTIDQLRALAVERRKEEREMRLYDALNDTLEQRESVAEMERQRAAELQAYQNYIQQQHSASSEQGSEQQQQSIANK
jgi:hypothetical protein